MPPSTPPSITELPEYDESELLTAHDLRVIESQHGCTDFLDPATSVLNDETRTPKERKASREIAMLSRANQRMTEQNLEHPPYAFVIPPENMVRLVEPDVRPVHREYLSRGETEELLRSAPLKAIQAMTDLKLQIILSDVLCQATDGDVKTFPQYEDAANAYAAMVSKNVMNWKQVVITAASSAKRSEFIVLKQILTQWYQTFGRMPSREEFEHVAKHSLPLLVLLASTHLDIFRPINERMVTACSDSRYDQFFFALVRRGDRGQVALRKDIIKDLQVKMQTRMRTMCLALHARDAAGRSLIEKSYEESSAIMSQAIYSSENPETRAKTFMNEKMQKPEKTIHPYQYLAVRRSP